MKDQATHIRIIRDENGKPVEAEYEIDNEGYKTLNFVDEVEFKIWAEANRIPVTGDWPDREVFAMEEVEEVREYECGSLPAEVAMFNTELPNTKKLRLKAKQEEPQQEAKTAEEAAREYAANSGSKSGQILPTSFRNAQRAAFIAGAEWQKKQSKPDFSKAMKLFEFSEIPKVNEFFQSLNGIFHDPNYQKLVEDFYKWLQENETKEDSKQ